MTPRIIRCGLDAIAARDADVATALAEVGYPAPRRRPPGFAALVDIILGQQVSAEAAAAIRARLRIAADPLTPETFLALDDSALRTAGLSRRKVEYARGIAREVLDGRLDLEALASLTDEEIRERLCALRGIGRWSADIYMLFALGRPDVWPADDLAIAVATQRLKRLRRRPDRRRLERIAAPWRPWRGVAALFLWHYYRGAP